ncbi:MAG: hypothetical protein ACOZDY_16045 [Pseudomonadota bacterium]
MMTNAEPTLYARPLSGNAHQVRLLLGFLKLSCQDRAGALGRHRDRRLERHPLGRAVESVARVHHDARDVMGPPVAPPPGSRDS